MKNIVKILMLFFLMITNYLISQNNYEEVVYLKNGSVIRGIIIEQVPNQSVKIQTKDRNIFFFKFDDIEKITKEINSVSSSSQSDNLPIKTEQKKRNFINYTEINFASGIGEIEPFEYNYITKNNDYSYGIKTSCGYQVSNHFYLGASIGIDRHKVIKTIPLGIELRYRVVNEKISPMFNANFGYALKAGYLKGGVVINTQVGIRTRISKNLAYLFNIGYKWQVQEVIFYMYNTTYTFEMKDKGLLQYITFSTGFEF
jgi:hypothetical protein